MYLKWIGGKTGVADLILPHFPKKINTYIEPFAGSGAMFFAFIKNIKEQLEENVYFEGSLPTRIILCDINEHLINCHIQVRDNVESVIKILNTLEESHNKLNKESIQMYKEIRTAVTDPITDSNKIELAANFIYINKTCFNGIWRVNKSGKNNVPFNNKNNINFDFKTIKEASELLSGVEINHISFENLKISTEEDNAFVYLDPPYYPVSKTSNFTLYNKEKQNDNVLLDKLKAFCDLINANNIKFIMSNSDSNKVYETFADYKIKQISAHRFVKALKQDNEKREKVQETLVINY